VKQFLYSIGHFYYFCCCSSLQYLSYSSNLSSDLIYKTNTGTLVRLVFLNKKIKEKCNVFSNGNGGGSLINLMFCFLALHNLPVSYSGASIKLCI